MRMNLFLTRDMEVVMRELSQNEIEQVSGGNPVLVMAAYVAIRYTAKRVVGGIATGMLGGATKGYLDSGS